jgi:hypothetical protein
MKILFAILFSMICLVGFSAEVLVLLRHSGLRCDRQRRGMSGTHVLIFDYAEFFLLSRRSQRWTEWIMWTRTIIKKQRIWMLK